MKIYQTKKKRIQYSLQNYNQVRTVDKIFIFEQNHPAGDVTRVSVMPRKVTVKSGMPRIGVGNAEIKINEKGQKFLFV